MSTIDDTSNRPVMFRFFGPVQITGAQGTPGRNPRRCEELLAYILLNPGTPAAQIADDLDVARTTIKTVAGYLRQWLGVDNAGMSYLPDGGHHGYRTANVTSDWHLLSEVITAGVGIATDEQLQQVLTLVRGRVLATAAPGEFLFAESIRSMAPVLVGEAAHELTTRALGQNDIVTARWASFCALTIDPGSEIILLDRIRTERAAGNTAEARRLAEVIAVQADALGVASDDETPIAGRAHIR